MEKVIFNKFDSVEQFSTWLQITPQTAMGKELNEGVTNSFKFTGTKSFNEAQELLKYGDKVNADKIAATIRKIKAQGKGNETRNKLYNSPCGFMPIVPKVLAGDPNNMLAIRKQRYNSTKVLNVVYNITVSGGKKKELLFETAAKVANVIASLEKNGYRVNLYVCFSVKSTCDESSKAISIIKIKDSGKYLDTLRIAYPLVNPSFLRRHLFAYLERVENYILWKGYGIPLDDDAAQKYIPLQRYSYLSYYICSGKTEEEIAKYIESAK